MCVCRIYYNITWGGSGQFITILHGGGSSETPKLYYVIYEQPLMQNYKQNRHPPEFGHPNAGTWQVRFPNCHIYFQRRLGNLTSTWQTTTNIIILVCKHSQQFPQLGTIGVFIWMHSTICVQNSNYILMSSPQKKSIGRRFCLLLSILSIGDGVWCVGAAGSVHHHQRHHRHPWHQ